MANKPKIKIVQYMHGTREYFPWSEWINRRYCERHQYEYAVRRDEPRRDRHICWHKVPIVLDELRDCDYLMFLDADAIFYSHELTLENELIPELHGKPILMTQDCASEKHRWCPGLPSSGVMLMKNEDRVKKFLAEWDYVSEIDDETRWNWPPEQRALRKQMLPKFENDLHIVLDYYLAQGRYGQFIRHFCPCSEEEQVNGMRAVYRRLNASVHGHCETTKPKIRVVQYHWGDQNRSYQVNREINEAYCRRHGHEYIVKTFVPRDDRSNHWAKIPAMREELHDCDFLLYLDADAFFYSRELRIEEELLPLMGGKQIMMSTDCVCETTRHQVNRPNTGVVLVRNSAKAAEILEAWDGSSERPGLEEFRFNSPHEQETCYLTICQEYAEELKLLSDYYLMNGLRGVFIRHLMGMQDDKRLEIQTTFLADREGAISVNPIGNHPGKEETALN